MPRYIDADAFEVSAHERYCAECDNYAGLKCRACWVDDMLGDIYDAPTLSPDDVRGVVKVNYEHGDYSCSACGHPARRLSFARKKYCDECGAKLLWEVSEDA